MDLKNFLIEDGVNPKLIDDVDYFRRYHKVDSNAIDRIPSLSNYFYGKEIWEMVISALLEGEHVLLSGPKATGKNLLADNVCHLFGRPQWNVSFNVNTDSANLIGTDTFENNEVKLRKGPVYHCATYGGFGVFDEINMAKNDAVVVLHSALDYRRIIDIPGYEKIALNDATRFIGTMNYDYAGTKDLNEALVSRFLVVDIPKVDEPKLMKILRDDFPDADKEILNQFIGVFIDLQMKSENGEISTKAVDLRGLIASLKTIRRGLRPRLAIQMGITGKTFDEYEKEIVEDVIRTRIPEAWTVEDVFPSR
ncbi:MoxR-like ATPase [Alkalibaculum bacchi]|uniref:MoxR-like ATPase n=1 Tax=Alkalibaculum bacchi TaxID=645887 RepID=A0A366IC41_9FIRM|nr:MoxR family ATPase [Alkalibaculum bacchi]RBP67364.1 MoxR-like ATPase [Alkalibaculum bacchi]